MTSHLDSHWNTDIKPEILSGIQTRNRIQHDEYDIRGIAHLHTYRKYDIFMQRQLLQNFTCRGKGPKAQSFLLKMEPFNNAHTALDIFRFAVFFLYLR